MGEGTNLAFSKVQRQLDLNYRKYGEKGINLLILHGLFGSGRNWNTFASKFKEQFQVWTLDARNHGDSPHSYHMNYYKMSEDIKIFLNKNRIKKVILLGHSMCGKTAMHFALNNQKRVLALIVVDIAPVEYIHYEVKNEILKLMKGIEFKPEMSRAEIKNTLEKKQKCDIKLIPFIMTNLIRYHNRFKWRIGLDGIDRNISEISSFPEQENIFLGPTKFIRGDVSEYINTENSSHIEKFFPKSNILTLKNCGHWPHYDDPISFNKAVKDFLNKINLL